MTSKLVSCVHLVNFDTGKIDIRIVGNTDRKIVKDISKNLKNWTGFDWIVNLVDDQGDETLDEKKNRLEKEELEITKNTQEMEKVLKEFPDLQKTSSSLNHRNKKNPTIVEFN